MRAAGLILGDWTHRRADPGGTRALAADVRRASPEVAWTWRPDHGGVVDQIRIAGDRIFVATMLPRDEDAPGWEHAVIYALDARTGSVVARRALPDPVPVAALVVDGSGVHAIATRKGEPIFWYALTTDALAPKHRRLVQLDRDARHEDVLDAWTSPDGGVWLELEGALGDVRGRAYAYATPDARVAITQTHDEEVGTADWGAPARDACVDGHALFAPLGPSAEGMGPALWRIEPKTLRLSEPPRETLEAPSRDVWMRADVGAARARLHAICAEGLVFGVALARDPERDDRAIVQAIGADKATSTVRWKTGVERVPARGSISDVARLARRNNGELLFQSVARDGSASTDLVCASPEGVEAIALGGRRRYVLDAVLGDLVLAHHESKSGRVAVGGFEVDRGGRLLGRRASQRWSVETPDLGGSTTVYAGAGAILVRGARAVAAIHA